MFISSLNLGHLEQFSTLLCGNLMSLAMQNPRTVYFLLFIDIPQARGGRFKGKILGFIHISIE